MTPMEKLLQDIVNLGLWMPTRMLVAISELIDAYATELADKAYEDGYNQGLQAERPRP